MPTPIEAYREGYERGRSDSAGGRLAEVTMGMLRDDPGGYFQKGYSDGAAAKPFNAPSIPAPKRLQTSRLLPKFSENPFGWLFGVLFVSYFWVLWQLIKAPFQLVGSLMRSEKPSPLVIVKNVVLAGLVIFFVWWVPHANEMRGQSAIPPQSANSPTVTSPLARSSDATTTSVQPTPSVSPQTPPVTQPPIVSAPPAPFPPRTNWLSSDYECRKIVSLVTFPQDEQGNYYMTAWREENFRSIDLGRASLKNADGKYLAEFVLPNETLRLMLTYPSPETGYDTIRLQINSTDAITNNPIAEHSRTCVLNMNGSY